VDDSVAIALEQVTRAARTAIVFPMSPAARS
jgi:hypothetical protein